MKRGLNIQKKTPLAKQSSSGTEAPASELPFRLLDLFSGIGGFSLGLERSGGFKTVAFCEIDPFCRKVLAKHWPKVPCYDDVRTLTAARLAADGISVDAICGGFPCQDISVAGLGAGIDGERSGLWSEYARIISELLVGDGQMLKEFEEAVQGMKSGESKTSKPPAPHPGAPSAAWVAASGCCQARCTAGFDRLPPRA